MSHHIPFGANIAELGKARIASWLHIGTARRGLAQGCELRHQFTGKLVLFIHEPARLLLLGHLASVKKADFVFLLNCTQLSRGNLSVQMTRLEERGLVKIDKFIDGKRARTVYEITRTVLRKYKKEMTAIWHDLHV